MWLPLCLPPLVQYPSSPATLSNSSRHLQKGKIISHINDVGGGGDNGQKGGVRGKEKQRIGIMNCFNLGIGE